MPVTEVVAKHAHGPFQNGYDSCFGRWTEKGMCPGVKIAEWLNNLGDDLAPYNSRLTNLQVRLNYIKSHNHIVAKEPLIADLLVEKLRLAQSLRIIGRRLREAGYRVER